MKIKTTIIVITILSCPSLTSAEKLCQTDIPNPILDGQIKIAEIFPNNSSDEKGWIGLRNVSDVCMDLAGWVLYDENDTHELFITPANSEGFEEDLLLVPQSEAKIFQKGDADISINGKGGKLKLFSGPQEMLGKLQDEVVYPEIAEGQNYRVIPVNDSESIFELQDENQSEIKDVKYKIPEDNSQKPNTIDNDEKKESQSSGGAGKSKEDKTVADSRDFNGEIMYSDISNDSTSLIGSTGDIKPIVASIGKEKSPWSWFYWLWGSWFLWRVILPFLVVWAVLYLVVYLIRRNSHS